MPRALLAVAACLSLLTQLGVASPVDSFVTSSPTPTGTLRPTPTLSGTQMAHPTPTPTRAVTATATPTRTATPVATAVATATSTPQAVVGDEWTQDFHDAQHTGASGEEPLESWSLRWIWNGSDANGGLGGHTYNAPAEARTVTGGGNVYVPAGSAGLYAVSEASGQLVWHLSSPAFNATPAYDAATGAVFAGGADGALYKVAAGTGQVLGSYATGSGGLNKSVLLVGSSAYVVGNNGALYRISTSTLGVVWVYTPQLVTVASPIPGTGQGSTPAAYSPSRDELIYATADLYVHAVANATGLVKWRVAPSPVQAGLTVENPYSGNTFDKGWPVIAEKHGVVLLRMQLDMAKAQDYPSAGGIYPTSNAGVRSWLQSNADHQNLFALSLDTGAAAFVPAVGLGYTEGWSTVLNGPIAQMGSVPVVKVWPNGDEVAYVHFRSGQSNPPDWRWDSHMGEMELDGTTVSGLSAGDLRFTQFDLSNGTVGYVGGAGYTFITDEQEPITMAGSTLFHAHWGASEGAAITNRGVTLGLSYGSPITVSKHPTVIRQQASCVDFEALAHWTTCGLNMYIDGRYWPGPGFWEYWNVIAPPGSPTSTAYSAGLLPRYTYVSDGLVLVEGNGGELYAFKHS